MNLGIYYFDTGEYSKALKKFELAYKLDSNTYDIKHRIEEAKNKLK